MRPVPGRAEATDLDFRADERWRGAHDGGTDIAADVDDNAPVFTGPGEMAGVHGYGATATGVTDGFE